MKKVIKLTESDLQDIIRRVVSEQIQKQSKSFSVGNSFPSAQYKIQNTESIDNAIAQIKSIISKYPDNVNFTINVNSGESRVPNPKGFEEEGSLAKARSNEVINYVKSKTSDIGNLNHGEPNITIGKTLWDPKKGKDSPEYTKEQFVNLVLNIEGERPLTPIKKPWYGIDSSGINYFIGFQDGSIYSASKNNPEELKLYAQIGKSSPFNKWRGDRRSLDILCRDYPKRCTQIKYDFGKSTKINSMDVVNEIVKKMQDERIPEIQPALS
jgi:hypothetical protein